MLASTLLELSFGRHWLCVDVVALALRFAGAVATAELCALRTDASSSVCTRGHATTFDGFEPPLSAEITLRELANAALLEASRQAAADLVRELSARGP